MTGKKILVTMEFVLRDDEETGLMEMDQHQLATEMLDLLEDEHKGVADWKTAIVHDLKIIET